MHIEIRTPELERLVQEEIQSGHFQNAEELLTEAIHALRERNSAIFATQAEAIEHARALNPEPPQPAQEPGPIPSGVSFRRVGFKPGAAAGLRATD